jgi:hypothetical protein
MSNKACQIVISEGKITALAFGNKNGLNALDDLKYANIKNTLYIDDMQFPMTKCASIKSSDSILEYLGHYELEVIKASVETEPYERFLSDNVIQFETEKSASYCDDLNIAV